MEVGLLQALLAGGQMSMKQRREGRGVPYRIKGGLCIRELFGFRELWGI